MRVTVSSQYSGFNAHINDLQEKINLEQKKLTTGKKIQELNDAPEDVVDIKRFDAKIIQNEKYLDVIGETVIELQAVDDTLYNITEVINQARQKAIDASNTDADAVVMISHYIKGYIEDVVKFANTDTNGHFLYGGTVTTPNQINTIDPAAQKLPYEIIEGKKTKENPSGLKVVFHGNNEQRIINKSSSDTEIINQRSSDLFGENGEVFDTMIGLYNSLAFTETGEKRNHHSQFTVTDMQNINKFQANLATQSENIDSFTSRNGSVINRLEDYKFSLQNENVRMKTYRSFKEDTDVAKSLLNLKREETSLQYALQVGSRMNTVSLFDFLR